MWSLAPGHYGSWRGQRPSKPVISGQRALPPEPGLSTTKGVLLILSHNLCEQEEKIKTVIYLAFSVSSV